MSPTRPSMGSRAAPSGARIAVLTPFVPRGRAGGVEVFCGQLEAALGPIGVFGAANGHEPAGGPLSFVGLEQAYHALHLSRRFLRAHRRNPFDLVISNGLTGWPLTFLDPGVPLVQVYHMTMAGLARQALPLRGDRLVSARVAGKFDRLAGRGKLVVSVSERVRHEVQTWYGHPSIVVPNAVDLRRFRRMDPSDAREQLGLDPDDRIGLFVGRSEYAKGFDRVVEVARAMPDVLFLAASRPKPAPRNVHFWVNMPHERMPLLYSAADFFLFPSRYEGFGLCLLEALACELPVVVSPAAYPFGDQPPTFAHVVDPPTRDGFVAAARECLRGASLRDVRQRIVEAYSLEVFTRNWQALVARALAEDGGRSVGRSRARLVGSVSSS